MYNRYTIKLNHYTQFIFNNLGLKMAWQYMKDNKNSVLNKIYKNLKSKEEINNNSY